MLGRAATIRSVEDVIVTKLRWAVERGLKDQDGVREIIAVQREWLDGDYV
jgi:hypothetical protein